MGPIRYICPQTGALLSQSETGLVRPDGLSYAMLAGEIPNFLDLTQAGAGQTRSLEMYDSPPALEAYRNFLDWLFSTFKVDEASFRRSLMAKTAVAKGGAILITGCGLGDDIAAALDIVGPEGVVYAQDLSPNMVVTAQTMLKSQKPERAHQAFFSVGDAGQLPFADNMFDAAFHFGGINLFDDMSSALAQMNRVVKSGGRVVVGDEGVAPWLRDTDFGRMVITNNHLWAMEAPMDRLPQTAAGVGLTWVLGNCFWVIDFIVAESLPYIDPHVAHKGRRGGTMWTRHTGQLEAVTAQTRQKVVEAAEAAGLSIHDWLEKALSDAARK